MGSFTSAQTTNGGQGCDGRSNVDRSIHSMAHQPNALLFFSVLLGMSIYSATSIHGSHAFDANACVDVDIGDVGVGVVAGIC